jgi:D-arabinose 1-dehydrogenase-like Zn-dependent alcohol dehydrogenase
VGQREAQGETDPKRVRFWKGHSSILVPLGSLTSVSRVLEPRALAGLTAAHAIHAAGVQAGDTVLIHGGAGGVGLIAVQLAVNLGATVVATAAQ